VITLKIDFSLKYSVLKSKLETISGKTLIFAHYDFDGITSAIIFSKILEKYGLQYKKDYFVRFGRDSEHKLLEDKEESKKLLEYNNLFFLDFCQTTFEGLENKNLWVFDHHTVGENKDFIINPAWDVSSEYLPSSSALAYDFYYYLFNEDKELKRIAALGAISDFMIFASLPYLHTDTNDSDIFLSNSQLIKPITIEITQKLEKLYSQKGNDIDIFENLLNNGIKGLFNFSEKQRESILKTTELELERTKDYLNSAKIDLENKNITLELEYNDKELKKYIVNTLELIYPEYNKIIYTKRHDFTAFILRSSRLDLTKVLNNIKKKMPCLNGGGHPFASGCAVEKKNTDDFLELLYEELNNTNNNSN
jgi:single-stranded DNA-specific DHH superfamily exonuclease